MKIKILQTSPVLGAVEKNLAVINDLVASHNDADLLITPELATHGYDLSQVPETLPLTTEDPMLERIGNHGPAVLVGFVESALLGQHNSAALLGAGSPVVQRKLTLPTYQAWEEGKHFIPGGRIHPMQVAGTRMATLICNDIWQPQLAWIAAQQGAEVLIAPANSVESNIGLATDLAWEMQLKGLAVSLQCYIIFVNRSGQEPCGRFWGGSSVYSPTGAVVARAGEEEQVLEADLDIKSLRKLRRTSPLLKESRADVVLRETQRLLDREAEDV